MNDTLQPPKKRHILVVSPIFGGSFPIAFASAVAMSRMDHEVTFLDMRCFADAYDEARKHGTPQAQMAFFDGVRAHIEHHVQRAQPELLLALAQAPLRAPLLEQLRSHGVVSALWFVEHFQRFQYWRALAPHYDWLLRIQEAPFDAALQAIGVRNQAYLPLATNPPADDDAEPAEQDPRYRAPLSFFGSPYRNRIELFSPLCSRGLSLWGKGWSEVGGPLAACVREGDAYLDTAIERRVYRGADIVLNLHSVAAGETVTDFINPRAFDVAGAGRFQLVDRRSLLSRHFTSDEMACFESPADLLRKVDHFLAHPEQREAMAKAARARVLAEHTYDHRMRQLLSLTLDDRNGLRAAV